MLELISFNVDPFTMLQVEKDQALYNDGQREGGGSSTSANFIPWQLTD